MTVEVAVTVVVVCLAAVVIARAIAPVPRKTFRASVYRSGTRAAACACGSGISPTV